MTEAGRWQVILTRQPERIIRRLPRDRLRRIDKKLLELSFDPRPEGCQKLTGTESLYRVRVGDWRIIYEIEDGRVIVLVLEISP